MSTPRAEAFCARISHRITLDPEIVEKALAQEGVTLTDPAEDASVLRVWRYLRRDGYRGIGRVEVGAALEAVARQTGEPMSTPTNGPREPHSLTRLIQDTIRAEQKRIAKMPEGIRVWNGEQATAWQNGMSRASRIAQEVVAHWIAARELTPGAVDLMVEAAARAMFEDPGTPGDYTWAQMVAEDVSRANLWRQDARRVLVAAGALHPRVLSAPQDDPTGPAWMERQIERVRTTPTEDEEASWTTRQLHGVMQAARPTARPGTCPSCRHQSHDGRVCLNAASDNDCACTHGAPKPPSDEQVLAALNAQVREDRRAPDLSYWGDAAVDSMRAALAAAQIAPTEMQLPLTKLSSFRLREIIEACQEVVDGRAADGVTS